MGAAMAIGFLLANTVGQFFQVRAALRPAQGRA